MQGSHLSRLADIAALNRIDLAPRDVHLRSANGMVYATYNGIYTSGTLKIEADLGVAMCSVRADQLTSVAALFDANSTLNIKTTNVAVTFSTSDRSALLRRLAANEQYDEVLPPEDPDIIVNREALTAEIAVAAEFVSAQVSMPVLNGVRIMAQGERLVVSAFDHKLGLYIGSIPAKCKTGEKLDITVQPKDMATALGVLHGDDMTISAHRNEEGKPTRLVLVCGDAALQTALINGEWPKLNSLLEKRERKLFKVQTSRLALVSQALRGFGAEKEGTITLITDGEGRLTARTVENDVGVFSIVIGETTEPLNVTFDAAILKLAVSLGDEISVGIATDVGIPVLVESGARRFYAPIRARQ